MAADSFDDKVVMEPKQQSSDEPSSSFDKEEGRPSLVRRKTGDPRPRPVLPAKKPVSRSMSGDGDARRIMMNKRAMSTRDFGGGRGFGMARNSGGGRGAALAQRSMSTRLLGAASDFTRMASTRALFTEEPETEPSIIMYMGREIKAEDHFDDDWLEDALDEEAGLKDHSQNRMASSMANSSRGSRRSSQDNGSRRNLNASDKSHSNRSDDEASEVEEDMTDEDEDDTNDGPKRRGRRGSRPVIPKRRSQSVEPAIRPKRKFPKRGVERAKTFDGRQTSEILPRRRKPKQRSSRQLNARRSAKLNKQFQDFLSKTGGVTPTGNHPYQNGQQFTPDGIRRRQPKMPTSRKKVEQFRRLEYTAEDIQDVLCEDDDTFQRLKRVLTKKGAITNGVLQQRLHIFLKKAKDRQSKLRQQLKAEEEDKRGDDGEADNMTNLQVNQPDWAAMSMMDMFANSVRGFTSGASGASSATTKADDEPKLQKKALPRMQAVMAKRNNMQAKKSSRNMMMAFAEEEEEDGSENHDNTNKSERGIKSDSAFRRRPPKPTKSAPSPIKRPKPMRSLPPISTRDSASDDNMHTAADIIEPKELPVASSSPMKLDLSQNFKDSLPSPKELPVKIDSPLQLDLKQSFKDALPVEPKCLDDELSSSQRPMELDLSQNFQDLPVEPKCLDDELSASQRPMKLVLKNDFKGGLPTVIEPKCLDDSNKEEAPMQLDLSGSGNQPLLFTPKNLDERADDDALLFQPKNLDLSYNKAMGDGSRMGGSESRSYRRNVSSGSPSGSGVMPVRSRVRRTKSCEDPPPLQIKCLDDPKTTPPRRNSNSTPGSTTTKSTPSGLLVGWNH